MAEAKLHWNRSFHFTAAMRDHELQLDVPQSLGGSNSGPTPKELLLAAIAGCAGMDVASMLKKQKLEMKFDVTARADTTETHPKVFKEIHLSFQFADTAIRPEPIREAVQRSLSLYCGVSAMVVKVSPINYEIIINGVVDSTGSADFKAQN